MKHLPAFVCLLLALTPTILSAEKKAAEEPVSGRVTGRVVNATTGEPLPSHPVTLSGRGWKDKSAVLQAETETDAEGQFAFEGLHLEKSVVVRVATKFQKVDYQSGQVVLSPDNPDSEVTLQAYESSEDVSNLSVPVYHVIVRKQKGFFQVSESFSVNNTGKTSVLHLTVNLPEKAEDLELGKGFMACCAQIEEGRILQNMPLRPGKQTYRLDYRMPLGPELPLSRSFAYGAESVLVITGEEGMKATDPALGEREQQSTGKGNYYTYTISEVEPGEELPLDFETGVKPSHGLLWALASLVFVAGFGAVVAVTLKKRAASTLDERIERQSQREAVLSAIVADVESLRESGDISDGLYQEFIDRHGTDLERTREWLSRNGSSSG